MVATKEYDKSTEIDCFPFPLNDGRYTWRLTSDRLRSERRTHEDNCFYPLVFDLRRQPPTTTHHRSGFDDNPFLPLVDTFFARWNYHVGKQSRTSVSALAHHEVSCIGRSRSGLMLHARGHDGLCTVVDWSVVENGHHDGLWPFQANTPRAATIFLLGIYHGGKCRDASGDLRVRNVLLWFMRALTRSFVRC